MIFRLGAVSALLGGSLVSAIHTTATGAGSRGHKQQPVTKTLATDDDTTRRQKSYGMSQDHEMQKAVEVTKGLAGAANAIVASHEKPKAAPVVAEAPKSQAHQDILKMADKVKAADEKQAEATATATHTAVPAVIASENTGKAKANSIPGADVVADMVDGAKKGADAVGESVGVKFAKEKGDWDMIKEYRAEKCVERSDPLHHDDCMKFMNEICQPGGKDGKEGEVVKMDGEKGENGSGKGFCDAFFDKVADQVKPAEEEKKEEEPKEEKKEEPKEEKKGGDGSEDQNLSSKEDGFGIAAGDQFGEDLAGKHTHVDGKTAVRNWRSEYGPRLSDTYESICNDHPYNEWCLSHGYGKYSFWTSPFPIFLSIALILIILMYYAMK